MRPILTLTLLLTSAGLSASVFLDYYPFVIQGFRPGMGEAYFASHSKVYGAIGGLDGRAVDGLDANARHQFFSACSVTWMEHLDMGTGEDREKEQGEELVCHRSEMSKFTVGGQPVYSVSEVHYESRAQWSIIFTLHTENRQKYVGRLKELFTERYGAPEPSEDGFRWEIESFFYLDSMVLSSGTLSLNRVDLAELSRQKQEQLESEL
jgi:hypothetical protein